MPAQLDQGANELIGHIVGSASRMGNLIGDLLQYSKTANSAEAPCTTVATNSAVEWAANNLKQAIEESGAILETGDLPQVRGDMVNLVQLFQNLIGNAIKYRSSRPPQDYDIRCRQDRQWAFSVADNGIGIPPAYHRTIFGISSGCTARSIREPALGWRFAAGLSKGTAAVSGSSPSRAGGHLQIYASRGGLLMGNPSSVRTLLLRRTTVPM